MSKEVTYRYHLAFYEGGLIRLFNNCLDPKPINTISGKKLIKVIKYAETVSNDKSVIVTSKCYEHVIENLSKKLVKVLSKA